MNTTLHLARLAFVSCSLTFSVAHADVFKFSYTFGDGVKASGSFVGNQNGPLVENISSVSLFFDGAPVTGTVFTSRFEPTSGLYLSGPVIAFDALQSNFVFSNSNLAGGDFGYDSLFYILKPSVAAPATAVGYAIPLGVFGSQDDPVVPTSWSLAAATSVADSGASAAMFALALFGLLGARKIQSTLPSGKR